MKLIAHRKSAWKTGQTVFKYLDLTFRITRIVRFIWAVCFESGPSPFILKAKGMRFIKSKNIGNR